MARIRGATIVIIILLLLLISSIGYIVVGRYNENKQKAQMGIFQEGINAGYQQAVIQLLQQAATCQAVPVSAQNITLNLIATECLRQATQ